MVYIPNHNRRSCCPNQTDESWVCWWRQRVSVMGREWTPVDCSTDVVC